MIDLINAMPDALRFAMMDAAPWIWDGLSDIYTVFEDGSISQ